MIKEHKHCRNCGNMITRYKGDDFFEKETFYRNVGYSNGFCRNCIDDYGLDSLCRYIHNEMTYDELVEGARR